MSRKRRPIARMIDTEREMTAEVASMTDDELVNAWNVFQWSRRMGIEDDRLPGLPYVRAELVRRGIPHTDGKRTIRRP